MTEKISTLHIFCYFLGTFCLWPIAYLTANSGTPTFFCPFSFTVVLPALFLSTIINAHIAIILAFISALFFFWSTPLLKGKSEIPKRSKILALFFIFLSLIFLVSSWDYGVRYQGVNHTVIIYLYNLISWVTLLVLFLFNKKYRNFTSSFLFHWVFFAWFGWVSFPWLGELL